MQKNLNIDQANFMKGNMTGSAITPDMVTYFARVINEAYATYQSDLNQNTQYIRGKTRASLWMVL
jgi:hypothetical protein